MSPRESKTALTARAVAIDLKLSQMFPDAKWVPRNKNEVIGERGFSEWTFIATRQADGAFFEMDGVDLFFFKDGKICIKDVYRKNREPIFPK
jgi:hypothetical protein